MVSDISKKIHTVKKKNSTNYEFLSRSQEKILWAGTAPKEDEAQDITIVCNHTRISIAVCRVHYLWEEEVSWNWDKP